MMFGVAIDERQTGLRRDCVQPLEGMILAIVKDVCIEQLQVVTGSTPARRGTLPKMADRAVREGPERVVEDLWRWVWRTEDRATVGHQDASADRRGSLTRRKRQVDK